MKKASKNLGFISALLLMILMASCGNEVSPVGESKIVKGSIVATPAKFWKKNHTLIITFLDGSNEEKKEVENFSKEIIKYANLNFSFYSSVGSIPKGKKIDVLITFNKTGNNSTVGTDSQYSIANGIHSMSLSELNKNFTSERRRTILHEFGHAIGLQHEHQNVYRTFKVDEASAKEYCKNMINFSEEECKNQIINTLPSSEKQNYFSKYDPASIMHYSLHSSITKEKIYFANVASLSLLDKLEIAKIYPGRISENEIILSHSLSSDEVRKVESYGNCQIDSSEIEQVRLNEQNKAELTKVIYYSYSSKVPGEYSANTLVEDKEGLLLNMRNDKFCNLNESELVEYTINRQQDNLKKSKLGNCEIPLTEAGLPKPNYCNSKYPFQVFEIKNQEPAEKLCYPTFHSAYKSMEEIEYCSLQGTALLEFEKERKVKFEASRKFGRCYVENHESSKETSSIRRCSLQNQWFVTIDRKKALNNYCHSRPDDLINEIQTEPKCL